MNNHKKPVFLQALFSVLLITLLSAMPMIANGQGGGSFTYLPIIMNGLATSQPLIVASDAFVGKFSPYYAQTSPDIDVVNLTQLNLLTTDRKAGVVYDAATGETREYLGVDYLYEGPANLTVTYNEIEDTTTYRAELRDDILFSDGTPITADDLIFTYYTLLDPTYEGPNVLGSFNILGVDEYQTQEGVPNIQGIVKVDDYTVEVTTGGYEAPAIYSILGIPITPLHYYGDVNKYDYANNQFGFDFGDLSKQLSLISQPLGAGPYEFVRHEGNTVYFSRNENYYKGTPKIVEVQFVETDNATVPAAIKDGLIDISSVAGSTTTFDEIASYNSNGELSGDIITTSRYDNLGYGYIGLNAATVNIAGIIDSDASKNLRKGISTIISVHRQAAIESYYGDVAEVIEYPISNTSWASPEPTDPGYQVAFSVDVDGSPIYTPEMTIEEKINAAQQAALGFFEAAGYLVDNGEIVEPPTGGELSFEVIVPGGGSGNHPAMGIVTGAFNSFAEIGLTLVIYDPVDINEFWDALGSGTQQLWAAAWGSSFDPDMYQVYYSTNIVGGGGTESNHYYIQDPVLDQLIMEARMSTDQNYRKLLYKQALDIIMDWGVEIPTYQRQNAELFSTQRVNIGTVTPAITTYWGWEKEIELLELND